MAIGDASWNDYEVSVPVTIRSATSAFAGVGILMRWTGHTDDPISGWQPKTGWWPLGALGWYRWTTSYPQGRLQLEGNQDHLIDWDSSGQRLENNVPYIFKMRVETGVGQVPWYGLKVWKEGDPEPADWVLSGQEGPEDPQHGSFLLLAHRVDANFGDVTVTSIREVCHSLSTAVSLTGSGSVNASPAPNCEGGKYRAGTTVQLTANPEPGHYFSHWSGDASGSGSPTTITVVRDSSVTAHFSELCYTLTTSVDPSNSGSVSADPAPNCGSVLYAAGTQVQLTATPGSGYAFDSWSGSVSGLANPIALTIDGNTQAIASFSETPLVMPYSAYVPLV